VLVGRLEVDGLAIERRQLAGETLPTQTEVLGTVIDEEEVAGLVVVDDVRRELRGRDLACWPTRSSRR
jgi:hypothetical protein